MKALSTLAFSVFDLSPIRPVTMKKTLLLENFEKMGEIHWENVLPTPLHWF